MSGGSVVFHEKLKVVDRFISQETTPILWDKVWVDHQLASNYIELPGGGVGPDTNHKLLKAPPFLLAQLCSG